VTLAEVETMLDSLATDLRAELQEAVDTHRETAPHGYADGSTT
jgi:hypothetical protein